MSDTESESSSTGVVAKTIGWSIVVFVLGALVDNKDAVLSWLLQISPDWLDPIAGKLFSYAIALVMLFIGPRQAPTTAIKSVWNK